MVQTTGSCTRPEEIRRSRLVMRSVYRRFYRVYPRCVDTEPVRLSVLVAKLHSIRLRRMVRTLFTSEFDNGEMFRSRRVHSWRWMTMPSSNFTYVLNLPGLVVSYNFSASLPRVLEKLWWTKVAYWPQTTIWHRFSKRLFSDMLNRLIKYSRLCKKWTMTLFTTAVPHLARIFYW